MTRSLRISRGRASGALLMLLGIWGGLIPFVGHYLGYTYTPDKAWAYTSGRLWLSIVPGAAAIVGGFFVLVGGRAIAIPGAFLAALGGAWFVLGQYVVALHWASITPGSPIVAGGAPFNAATMKFLEGLGFFYGLGVLIVFIAALAMGQAVSAVKVAAAEEALPADAFEETAPYPA